MDQWGVRGSRDLTFQLQLFCRLPSSFSCFCCTEDLANSLSKQMPFIYLLCQHSEIQRSFQKYITDIKQTKLKRQTVDRQRQQRLLSSRKGLLREKNKTKIKTTKKKNGTKSDHSTAITVTAMISFIVKPVQQQWYWPLSQDEPSTMANHRFNSIPLTFSVSPNAFPRCIQSYMIWLVTLILRLHSPLIHMAKMCVHVLD